MKFALNVMAIAAVVAPLIAADEPPVTDVPKLEGIVINGDGADWGDHGFRVEIMANTSGAVKDAADFDPTFRLGWDEKGLLVLATVKDDVIRESTTVPLLRNRDSVEMVLAAGVGVPRFFSAVCGTGVDARFPGIRTFLTELTRPLTGRKIEVEVASRKVDGGYQFEARLPWSNIDVKPQAGGEAAFQIIFSDTDSAGTAFAATWYPSEGSAANPKALAKIRLAEAPSASVTILSRVGLDEGRPRVDVVGISSLVGQMATLEADGSVAATAKLLSASGRARATFIAPEAAVLIKIPGQADLKADCKDINALIASALPEAVVAFTPCVFSGEEFPPCSFGDPGLVFRTLGRCTLTPTFYDNDYNLVTKAERPGRYGAIVELQTHGKTYKQFVTLYRTKEEFGWKAIRARIGQVAFSPEIGLDPSTVAERVSAAGDTFSNLLRSDGFENSEPAWMLAALDKQNPAQPAYLNHPMLINAAWWYGLKKKTGNLRTDYYVRLPVDYEKKPDEKWPVLLMLHGSGWRGYDSSILKRTGPLRDFAADQAFPFITIVPQCLPGETWSPWELAQILDEVEAKYRVDKDREYVTGMSMGGFGTFALANVFPERFAAIAPVCGGGDPADVARIARLPLWAFHGALDDVVPPNRSAELVDAVNNSGGEAKLTILPDRGHNIWGPVYAMPEIATWLLQHRRGQASVAPSPAH